MAMSKIVGEAEILQKQEVLENRRRQIFGRVRAVFVFLFVATLLVVAFCYHTQLQETISAKLKGTPAASNGQTSAALKSAQDNAAARDQIVNQITK